MDTAKPQQPVRPTLPRRDLDALRAFAKVQHCCFTWDQALRCGWSHRCARDAINRRWWKVLYRGVYVDRDVWAGLDAAGKHRCRVAAKLLLKGPEWVAARESAAVFHGLPLLGKIPDEPRLLRDYAGTRANGGSGDERVATLPPSDIVVVAGVRVTSLARTVLDLAAEHEFRHGVVVADAALRRGLDQGELLALAEAHARWPGNAQALRVARFADGLSESVLESISRAPLLDLGIAVPELQLQVWFDGVMIARVDQCWRQVNTIGQADGALKYKGLSVDAALARVRADKRQDETLESVGFEVVRWGWEQAWEPTLMGDRLRRGFVRGAAQSLDPRVRLVPTTLAQSVAWASRYAE